MVFLSSIARALLLRRLFSGGSRRGRSRRRSSGFGMRGPFPSYSGRTRRGSRVTVTGCCLPIPLGMLAVLVAAVARLLR